MEYTQWEHIPKHLVFFLVGLNPCCNGIYSMSAMPPANRPVGVLILVVMEYTQWEETVDKKNIVLKVLILVVMEYTQWEDKSSVDKVGNRLNPCCNGIYSMSHFFYLPITHWTVLILVVMEYTQWELGSSAQ